MNTLEPLTDEQAKRVASAAIAGYQYQFAVSIKDLLKLADSDSIRVEGIEDVDVSQLGQLTAVQVKYYQAQEWSLHNANIRKALHAMYQSHRSGHNINYILHIAVQNKESVPSSLTMQQIQECFTFKKKNQSGDLETVHMKNFEDTAAIRDFASALSLREGSTLEVLLDEISAELSEALSCGEEEAKVLHLPRAIALIQSIASEKDDQSRILTRSQLLEHMKVREYFYTLWHREEVGLEKYKSSMIKKLRSLRYGEPNRMRGIAVAVGSSEGDLSRVADLVELCSNDYMGADRKRTAAAKPWTVVLDGDDRSVREIKQILLSRNVRYFDGYEEVYPMYELLAENPIVNVRSRGDILSRASFTVRVVSCATFEKFRSEGYDLPSMLLVSHDRKATSSAPGLASAADSVSMGGLDLSRAREILEGVLK